ncbi:glycine betaine ABC transporter substrate-binding protein [Desulfosporosinus sp. BG]|uniref:glycine betaine ABC transporter substrate-binding protein n=1 Tax=Desulfosporosinus sp. BG TaxID=1633135 RepID=UPI00083AA1E7|nr:glycine betaine ABC transporter substrate-binding protein [Desulfosporosinus sp. BG]ODA42884.1 Glycine betaine ABC transport system, glycine betaine-binding protein OpuAC [Desulfosporosinus sp. BG]
MNDKVKFSKVLGLLVIFSLLVTSLLAGCGQQTTDSKQPEPTAQQPTDKGTVKIGMVTWAEDVAISNVVKTVLEDKGYKVELQTLDVAPLFVGLSRGDLDLYLDGWLPTTQKNYWDKYQDKLEKFPGSWYEGEARSGLVVPKYVTTNTVDEIGAQKDKLNGEIIGIDPGANVMKTIGQMIKDNGWNIKLVSGSEAAMMAALDKAYREKKWIVIYGWSPHWMFAKYDLKFLEDTKNVFGASEQIVTLANKDFSKKMPEVADMIKKMKMNDKQIGTIEDMINGGMAPIDAAKKWVEDNKTVVDGWFK